MNSLLSKYDFFIFDLDDTLYPEIKYFDEAYKNISEFLAKKTKKKSFRIHKYLIDSFKETGRSKLFDNMFNFFGIDTKFLESILEIMRTYEANTKISLYSNMYTLLPIIINSSKKVFIVTNGNVIQQKNKVNNIEWKSLENELVFIYANEFKKKPSNRSFQYIKKIYTIKEDLTLMVGDSIFDKEYAENCKIDFMFIEEFNAIKN